MGTKGNSRPFLRKSALRGLVVGCCVFLFVWLLITIGLLGPLEWKTWDLRLAMFTKTSDASPDIVLILIDQYSLDIYEEHQGLSWPWPRQIYSALVSFLKEGEARACVFDMIFSESSPYGVDDDLELARSIKEFGDTFLAGFLSEEEGNPVEISPSLLLKNTKSSAGIEPDRFQQMGSVTLPIDEILGSARAIGNVNFKLDKDGIYRRIPLLFSLQDTLIPALALSVVDFSEGGVFNIDQKGRYLIKDKRIPLDRAGRMIIRYHGPQGTYKSYSAAAIINSWALMEEGKPPQISPEDFKDKIVFFGTSAPGLYDLRSTPLSAVFPGVEIQATVADNLFNGDFISVFPQILLFMYVLFLAVLTGIGISALKKTSKILFFLFLCLALPVAASVLAFFSGLWLDIVPPLSAVILSFSSASVLNYVFEGRQKRFIKNVFGYYLSPHVIEQVLENPDLLRLGGEKREITSFFSDLAGFTAISEKLSPEILVQLLNGYLTEMTDIILSFQGTLDKYEGDAIIAFWNAPLLQPDHALRACRATLRCQARLAELRPFFKKEYGCDLSQRIGLNSGQVIVGNMGSRDRFDYTAIGDTVNLASRLEGACKQYKVPVLLGEETYRQVQDSIVGRRVDVIRVVGKQKPVKVYEILGEKGEVNDHLLEKVEVFQQALQAYEARDWEKAEVLLHKQGDDMLAQIYLDRVRLFKQSPPPDRWDGVFELKIK